MKNHYIAIEGVIGVGKTTLARLLQPMFGSEILLEVFEENPFLPRFYQDRERYAFQTQIFFLLSRYRQQHEAIPDTLTRGSLISDYMFDKNKIFARLTLVGDELEMYERVQDILAGRIPKPDLVVYLKGSVEVLMERITLRDRVYERSMEREYIASLACAYDQYFSGYHSAPVLALNTDDLDFVHQRPVLDEVGGANSRRAASEHLSREAALTMKNFIAVAGNIGVGKSTMVRIMYERLGWEPFYEAVVENPYLADFYSDMPRYAFHSQIFFSHAGCIRTGRCWTRPGRSCKIAAFMRSGGVRVQLVPPGSDGRT